MLARNFYEAESDLKPSHDGIGAVKNVYVYRQEDFDTRLRFIIYSELEPGRSIGYHQHGDNEELYVILEGQGTMTVNGESRPAKPGDVFLNKANWSHGLVNDSTGLLKILVFEVAGESV